MHNNLYKPNCETDLWRWTNNTTECSLKICLRIPVSLEAKAGESQV